MLIDFALDRRPFAGPASELPDRFEPTPRTAFITWRSVSNFCRRSPIPAITPEDALAELFG